MSTFYEEIRKAALEELAERRRKQSGVRPRSDRPVVVAPEEEKRAAKRKKKGGK